MPRGDADPHGAKPRSVAARNRADAAAVGRYQTHPAAVLLSGRWFRAMPDPGIGRRPGFGRVADAGLVLLGWTAFAVALSAGYTVQRLEGWPVPFAERLSHFLPYYWIWAALTPVVVAIARRVRARFGSRPLAWTIHAIAAVLIAIVQVVVYVPISLTVGSNWGTASFAAHLTGTLTRHLLGNALTYGLVVMTWFALEYRRRMQEALAHARLEALRMQLQPHFLFNSLEAASATMHHDVPAAEEMLERLAAFLRGMLRRDDRHLVPLREELELLDHYLAVMRGRFGPRLTVSVRVEEGLAEAMVPVLILQPLVENALRHGLARRAGPGRVDVSVEGRNGKLTIRVTDDGPGLTDQPGQPVTERIGLSNTRARLEQLFGRAFTVRLTPDPAGGTRAELEFPLMRGGQNGADPRPAPVKIT